MTALVFQNVWKEYKRQIVLERIDVSFEQGSFVSVVGPSGCGKTTFLRMILGQEVQSRGVILLDGQPIAQEAGPDRGIVFQRYSVFPHLTVLENILIGYEFEQSPLTGVLRGLAREAACEHAHILLEKTGLTAHKDKFPRALSGGMQQRLALAQALAKKPRILLLDEPFGALDPGTKAQMHELVRAIWLDTHMTIIMVTHDIREAFHLGTRVIAFDRTRHDPQAPERFGATITYDIPMNDPIISSLKPQPRPDDILFHTQRSPL
jgi:NitT/TauT family transport system ATP-binding protein